MHFSMNNACTPAAFLANFPNKDPGTQTIWSSLMMVPNPILNAATGIPESTFSMLKSNYPLVTAPGTGGEECLKRCGLTFKDVRLSFLLMLAGRVILEMSHPPHCSPWPTINILPKTMGDFHQHLFVPFCCCVSCSQSPSIRQCLFKQAANISIAVPCVWL